MKPIITKEPYPCTNCGKKAQGIIIGNVFLCYLCWNEVREVAQVIGPILVNAHQRAKNL